MQFWGYENLPKLLYEEEPLSFVTGRVIGGSALLGTMLKKETEWCQEEMPLYSSASQESRIKAESKKRDIPYRDS